MDKHTAIEGNKNQLVKWLESGEKSKENWRIGTEHEKFLFHKNTSKRVSYDEKSGVFYILDQLMQRNQSWRGIYEDNHLVGLLDDNNASITLEPAGQLELSGAPVQTIHETCAEIGNHLTA